MQNRSSAAGAAGAGVGGFMMGMMWGVLVGGVVALLFAPQTGTQTREMIRNRAGQIGDAFRGTMRDTGDLSARTAEQMRQGAEEIRESVR